MDVHVPIQVSVHVISHTSESLLVNIDGDMFGLLHNTIQLLHIQHVDMLILRKNLSYDYSHVRDVRGRGGDEVKGDQWRQGEVIERVNLLRESKMKEVMKERGSEGGGWEGKWSRAANLLQVGYPLLLLVHQLPLFPGNSSILTNLH